MAALAQGHGGRLRIGTFQSVGASVLPAVMRRFPAEWPQRRARADRVAVRRGAAPARRARRARARFRDAAAAGRAVRVASSCSRDPYVLLVPAEHELGRAAARKPRRARRPDPDRQPRLPQYRAGRRRARRSAASQSTSPSAPTTTAPCRASSELVSVPRSCRCSRSTGTTSGPRARARPRDPAPADRARLASRPPPLPRRACVRRRRARRSAPTWRSSWFLHPPSDRLARRLELPLAEADVRVPPDRAREDADLFCRDRACRGRRARRADGSRTTSASGRARDPPRDPTSPRRRRRPPARRSRSRPRGLPRRSSAAGSRSAARA